MPNKTSTTRIRRAHVRTMPQMVADDIRLQIARGELRPGDSLSSEKELLEIYRLSRPTLREAMRILEAESLIETQRGSKGGAIITAPDPVVAIRQAGMVLQLSGTTIADVYLARSIIEPPAARLLAEYPNEAAIKALNEVIEQGNTNVGDALLFAHTAGLFHRRLVEVCGNSTLTLFARILTSLTDTTYELTVRGRPPSLVNKRIRLALRSWVRLVELIQAGKPDEAEGHWRTHMAEVGKSPAFAEATAVIAAATQPGL